MTDTPIDAKSFWHALGERPIGVSVVTARDVSGSAGFLALSASHVTANPPAMLVSIDQNTAALAPVLRAHHFAVNYLPVGHEALADIFGGRSDARGADRFDPALWHTLVTGAPVLRDAVAVIDCVLEQTFQYSSTTVVIGRVAGINVRGGSPLIFHRGGFHHSATAI